MSQGVNIPFGASLSGGAQSVFKTISSGLKDIANGLKLAAKEQINMGKTDVGKILANYASGLEKVVKSQKKYNDQAGKGKKNTDEQARSYNKLNDALKRLSVSFEAYSRYMIASSVIKGLSQALTSGVDAIIEYDQALHDLKAITLSSATETLLLGNAMVEVATNTKFSMGEVGSGMKKLAQAGFNAAEVTTMINSIAELATGSLEGLDVTVGLVSTAIRVFRLDVSDVTEVADIFSNAINRSRLTISGLATTFNYIGPIAAATGLSLKDTNAAMMLLANSGLRFSTIGTGLRRIIGGLAKPSGKFKDAILGAGYTLADFNPNLSDFRSIIEKIPNVVKDSTDAISFFGYRGSSVISALSTQGIEEFDRLRASLDRTGTTSEMAKEQMKGLQNAIKNLKDRFGVLAKTLSEGGFVTAFKGFINLLRSLVDVLITLSGSVFGKTILSIGTLTAALGVATAAGLVFIKVGLGAKLALWVVSIARVSTAMLTLGSASATATIGVTTLSGAIKALTVSMGALLLNPIAIGLSLIATGIGLLVFQYQNYKKSLRDTIIEEEKYSDSLDQTISKLDKYNKMVLEHGSDSVEAESAGKNLRKSVINLGETYENVQDNVNAFTSKIGDNTTSLENNKDAVKDLRDVLQNEYERSVLKSIAASEKLMSGSRKSTEELKKELATIKAGNDFLEARAERMREIKKRLGMRTPEDPLNFEDIEKGFAYIDLLQVKAAKNDEKAKENLRILMDRGKDLKEILISKGLTEEDLSNRSIQEMYKQIKQIENLSAAQALSAASYIKQQQEKKEALDKLTDAQKKAMEEDKRIANEKAAFGEFGLTIDGVTKKLESSITKFKKFADISKTTGSELVEAFKNVGNEVKNTKDFELFKKSLEELRKSDKLTIEDFQVLKEVVESVSESVRTASNDMEKSLKNKIQIIDTDEQRRIAEEWEEFTKNQGTKNEITEKEHQKNLELIEIDTLRKKKQLVSEYYTSIFAMKDLEVHEYQEASLLKYKADEDYLKALAKLNKPKKIGRPEERDPQAKVKDTVYDLARKKQSEATKTMISELKASYEIDKRNTEQYFKERQVLIEEHAQKEKDIIKNRIDEVNKEFSSRISNEKRLGVIKKLEADKDKQILVLKNELNVVGEKRKQQLASLAIEEKKVTEAKKEKIRTIIEELQKQKENANLADFGTPEETKMKVEMDQLTRHLDEKIRKLEEAGAEEVRIAEAVALKEEIINKKKAQNEKELNDLKLKRQAQFFGDMASTMKDLTEAGIFQSKKAFKAYKAFAIVQATISTYESAVNAFNSMSKIPFVGPALGTAAAAAAIASGLARVAAIKAEQPPSFAFGGIIPGPRRGDRADNVRINATPGEYVNDKPTVDYYGADFFAKLKQRSIPKEILRRLVGSKQPNNTSGSNNYANGGVVSNQNYENFKIEITNESGVPLKGAANMRSDDKGRILGIVLKAAVFNEGSFGSNMAVALSRRG